MLSTTRENAHDKTRDQNQKEQNKIGGKVSWKQNRETQTQKNTKLHGYQIATKLLISEHRASPGLEKSFRTKIL